MTTNEETQPDTDNLPGKPDFLQIVSAFGLQTLMACGKVPNPITRQSQVDLNMARYHIGVLEVLEDKTRGNLNDEEQKMLAEVLHQARMIFVEVSK